MYALKIAAASFALWLAAPGIAAAQEGMSAGIVTGALTGAVIGGPIGAIAGGVAGAAIGGMADVQARPRARRTVLVRRPRYASAVIQRTCVRDRAGNQTCREIIR